MINYTVIFPEDFDEYLWEYQAKGRIANVIVQYDNHTQVIEICDTTRFKQDIGAELKSTNFLFYKNLILVEQIDKETILNAIKVLIQQQAL